MGYIILGIIAIAIAIGILKLIFSLICAILSFMWDHKGASITVIVIIALVAYYNIANHPFEFLPVWGNNIKAFFWGITYQHTVFDAIWVYALLFCIAWVISEIMLLLFSKEILRIITCSVISISFIVASCLIDIQSMLFVLAIETFISVTILWSFRLKSMAKIGLVKDVSESFVKIESPNLQVGIMGWFAALNIMKYVNQFFDTAIPSYVPIIIFNLILIGVQTRCYIHLFKGYRYIYKFTQNNVFFCYDDYGNADELKYLIDAQEYSSSVTDILESKKKIYLMPFGKRYYMNNQLRHQLEKCIKANFASNEIEKTVNADFRNFGFEKVYKTIFSWVKGYEIDFTESEEAKNRRNTEIGIGATEFVLMRYPIENHPLLKESLEVRADYITALNGIVCRGNIDRLKWDAKVEEFCKVFEIDSLSENIENAIQRFSDVIRRKESVFRTVKSDYSYVLLMEAIYFQNLLTVEDISYKEIESIFERLKIKRVHRDFIYQYIKSMFIDGDIHKAEILLQSKVKMDVRRVLEYVHHNIMWNERYVVLNQYNVAVCATMSAGKSTFINSMLGTDFIPAKNEACTAKITTIRDNDNLDKIIGCYTRTDNSKVYSNVIDGALLSEWNEDTQVCETILEGDLEEISCQNGVLVMHDTPGTNNSGDDSHHDKTIDFLKQNNLDLVIYLINAEYISTNDTEILLKEIQEIEKNKNTKIVFGLNKIDCFDEEGDESLDNAMKGLYEQLQSYGFESPMIFPFSANAARLFKLVVKDKELTKREQRDFGNLMERFTTFDASDHIIGAVSSGSSEAYPKLKKDKKIVIKDVEYSYNNIIDALNHTGILNIENWMAEEMNRRNQ